MRLALRSLALPVLAALASLAAPGAAQQLAPIPAAAAAATTPPTVPVTPALWKLSDKDTTIYLFGTIHALPAGVNWLTGPVEAAFRKSDQLVTEIPETDAKEMQNAILSNAMLPASQTLRGLLSAEDKAKLEGALASFKLPPEAFDRFEPWYAAVALTTLPLAKEGYSADTGAEETISAAAKQLGKPRMGLETAAYQLSLFDGLPMEVQKKYLRDVIDGLPTLDTELAAMIREWSAGHADKLAELLNDKEDDPRISAVLLTGRNKMWANWAKKRMAEPGTVFVAVGAGHLAGKESMLTMLTKNGLKVERIQ
ncbi:TraB/GumN family protein [Novosphingobium flavum]|uniref:TraB/GumN family protein n=1 Tax=Novosphingobium flavum TaxID=1778672 RepID=A0A7X1FPR7_9SPHN|nr:TraB/GumN family protein [Novosphingobium flavum]MBC2664735.1 TraB/GumN family protein [Novosphingobium flavum]